METIRRQDFFHEGPPYVSCDTILFLDRCYGSKFVRKIPKRSIHNLSVPRPPVDGLGTSATRRSPCIRRNNNSRLYFATSSDHPGWPGHVPFILNCIWIRDTYARGCQSASFLWFSTKRCSVECLNATDRIREKPHRRARSSFGPRATTFFAIRSDEWSSKLEDGKEFKQLVTNKY